MALKSVFLVTLVVDDYDRAKTYYCDVLGFECLEDSHQPDGKRWVVVSPCKGTGAALLLAVAANDKQTAVIGKQTGGRVGFFLETDDFLSDYARLKAAGVAFREAPRSEPYGTVAVFADLYGNLWDLIEPQPEK
ncbi:VOC family protein [Peteryoungia desertarenae]|uniref:VOC family protein n=1 Tax=Peteryoungia desertarenae TaxID=1813451 RepID=A0ABX6QKU8_9HYPH|nr:VOC family protein [Peteryoungia desertarenae]QLF69201.1 VOC family protein [Peteryoungia desertarenae]